MKLVCVALVGILTATSVAADRAEAEKAEKKKIVGVWKCQSLRIDDVKATPDDIKTFKLSIKGDTWIYTTDDTDPVSCTWAIDPTQAPKHLDLTGAGLARNIVLRGFYELKDDTLTVWLSLTDPTERPAKAVAGPGTQVFVWKRATK